MAIKQQRPAPSVEAPQTGVEQETETTQSSLGPRYTVAKGDTLLGISRRAYGSAIHWRTIMDANPTKVFKGGSLIVVGDELTMPPVGHVNIVHDLDDEFAMEPERFETPYGRYLVLPEGYEGTPDPVPGWTIVKAGDFKSVEKARITEADRDAEAALKSAEELLSYSWNDWAITDQNAIDAMNLVADLPLPQRQATLSTLDLDLLKRLFSNLPKDIKSTVSYAKLLVGFGMEYALNRLNELQVLFLSGKGEEALEGLPLEHMDVLVAALPVGGALSEWQEAMLHSVFLSVPDSDLARLEALFEKRFDMDLKALEPEADQEQVGVEWDAPQLRRMWTVLMNLPEADVEDNESIDSMERYTNPNSNSMGGWFWGRGGDEDQIAMGFETSQINDTVTWMEEADAVQGDVYFDQALRHEVGHAVDDRDGIMDSAQGDAVCGSWKVNHATDKIAKIWLMASGGLLGSLEGGERDAAHAVMVQCMNDEDSSTFVAEIAGLPFWQKKGIDGLLGKVAEAKVSKQLIYALNDPWYSDDQMGHHVRGTIYQKSYEGYWTSYRVKAKRHRVSSYQWRAPGEWFAEVYATYYDPRFPRGSRLAEPVRKWFEKHTSTPSAPE